jgi:M6 family metalloprotease-like protein
LQDLKATKQIKGRPQKRGFPFIMYGLFLAASILAVDNEAAFCAADNPEKFHAETAEQEVLKILAIRVDFLTDSLITTTGSGKFESAFQFDEHVHIDPLPHNQQYFFDHLEFLNHYYSRVSSDRLRLEWEVWPQHSDSVYHLDNPMWHYNWNESREKSDEQLAQLFEDSWIKADLDPDLYFFDESGDFRFDSFLIFHAGVGQDFGQDRTPHDIPSAYLGPADLEWSSLEFPGGPIVADASGNSGRINSGIILPEAENHETFEQSLAGTIVIQFGHVLGLPNLYDGENSESVIGKWGLMDQGSANFRGLLPALPSAWTRLYKSWDDVIVLDKDTTDVEIASLGSSSSSPRIYQIPLNDNEYLLIENRVRDRSGTNTTWARDRAGNWALLDSTYTLQYMDTSGVAGDTTGVLIEVGDLDFDLPGSGILIWHVDQTQITPESIADNSINTNPDRRGIDIEEGDGVQDIGRSYSFFSPRSGLTNGSYYDPWFGDNSHWKTINTRDDVEFSWRSLPSTESNESEVSGLRLYDFSVAGDLMTFSLKFDFIPAFDGISIAPPQLETDNSQLYVFDLDIENTAALSEETWISLRDFNGTVYSYVVNGSQPLHLLSNGFTSLFPVEFAENIDGFGVLHDSADPRLLSWRNDSLFVFGRDTQNAGVFELIHIVPFAGELHNVLITGDAWHADQNSAAAWTNHPAGIYALVDDVLMRIDPDDYSFSATDYSGISPTARLIETRDFSGLPAVLSLGTESVLMLAGQLIVDLESLDNLRAFALDDWSSAAPLSATLALADAAGISLYAGATLMGRIDCPNIESRPIQYGSDKALEVACLGADGVVHIFNQSAVEIATLNGPFHNISAWISASRDAQKSPVSQFLSADKLHLVDDDGREAVGWPRRLSSSFAGVVTPPDGSWICTVDTDGDLQAWESELANIVWPLNAGNDNGGYRPISAGDFDSPLPPVVTDNKAFVWPNPVKDIAHFRVHLTSTSLVALQVFDLAGDLKYSDQQILHPALGNDAEIKWDTTSHAPGGYFCILKISPQNGDPAWSKVVKCAVIR